MRRSMMRRAGFTVMAGCSLFALGCGTTAPQQHRVPDSIQPAQVGPESLGEWSQPFKIRTSGIHSSLLPTGEVLLFAYQFEGGKGSNAQLWNPETNELTDVTVPDKRELFCSGHTLLADGRLFVASGTKYGTTEEIGRLGTDIFDPFTRSWTKGPDLAFKRWYPTTTELPDGNVLIFSGQRNDKHTIRTVERYDPETNTIETLPRSANRYMDLYPRMHLLPDGRMVHTGPENRSFFFDPATSQWRKGPYQAFGYRGAGSAVLLPGLSRVLVAGGAEGRHPTRTAEVLELSDEDPQWRPTTKINHARMHAGAVLLPDGKVFMVGGGRHHEYDKTVKTPELFDPGTESWTDLAPHEAPRAYHSTALLLPDGRVLSAGHDNGGYWLKAEVYSPPYLFKGQRPVVHSAPERVGYGESFQIAVDNAAEIGRVALLKPGSATHGVDFSQRYVDLEFAAAGTTSLTLTAPANGTIAPPGPYMLFVIDGNGVPSEAAWVSLG